MLEAPSSYVPGGRYKPKKSRELTTGKWDPAKKQIGAEDLNRGQEYTHRIRLVETNNFHFWSNPIGGLYKKIRAFKETKKKKKGGDSRADVAQSGVATSA